MGEVSQERLRAFSVKSDSIQKALRTDVTIISKNKAEVFPALWDTGATNSCISMDVVKELDLVATGKINMRTPTGEDIANTYLVDIVLPNNVSVKDLMVCDSKIGSQGIGMLVGMDIISQGDFCVSNYQGRTIFSFRMPSNGVMDFVTGIKISNIIGSKHGPGGRKPRRK